MLGVAKRILPQARTLLKTEFSTLVDKKINDVIVEYAKVFLGIGFARSVIEKIEANNEIIKKANDVSKTFLEREKYFSQLQESSSRMSILLGLDIKNYEFDFVDIVKNFLKEDLIDSNRVKFLLESYDRPFFRTKRSSLKNFGNASWAPLFKKKLTFLEFEGMEAEELLNAEELEIEGKALNHCVAMASGMCAQESYHIFSIKDRGQNLATLAIIRDEERMTIRIDEESGLRGFLDGRVSDRVARFARHLLDYLSSQEINYDFLKEERQKRVYNSNRFVDLATAYLGLNPLDENRCRELRRVMLRLSPSYLKPSLHRLENAKNKIVINAEGETLEIEIKQLIESKVYHKISIQEVRENEIRNKSKESLTLASIQENLNKIFGINKIQLAKIGNELFFEFLHNCKESEDKFREIAPFKKEGFLSDATFENEDGSKSSGVIVKSMSIRQQERLFKKIAQNLTIFPSQEIITKDFLNLSQLSLTQDQKAR